MTSHAPFMFKESWQMNFYSHWSVWKMKHLGSTGMLWTVLVCSGQYQFVFGTGMLWTVPVLPRAYRYCTEHTGTTQSIPVLYRTYQYCPEHTGTVQLYEH